MLHRVFGITIASAAVLAAAPASALPHDVTNAAIFGTGNVNGSFTIDRNEQAGVEVGLRAQLRFNPVYNFDGVNTYTFLKGGTVDITPPLDGERARWNFEYSVNSNYLDPTSGGRNLDDLRLELIVDLDPTANDNLVTFDFYTIFSDNSHGDNDTGQSGGVEAAKDPFDPSVAFTNQSALRGQYNLVQNSQNFGWLTEHGLFGPQFDYDAEGTYAVTLKAYRNDQIGTLLASTSIFINVVPEPAAFGLLGLGLVGLAAARRRKA